MKYRSKDGDVLDAVCRAYYTGPFSVEVVLAANPGLAAYGPVLPAGIIIHLPEQKQTEEPKTVRLWD